MNTISNRGDKSADVCGFGRELGEDTKEEQKTSKKHISGHGPGRAWVALAMILIMAWAWVPAQADDVVAEMYVLCRPDDTVNIRHKPTTHSERCGWLMCGDRVDVSDSMTDRYGVKWYRVEDVTEYGYGWVSGGYLADSPVEIVEQEMVIISNGRTAIRKGINGSRAAWGKPGQVVQVLAMADDWTRITSGYIRTEYLGEKE